MSDRALSSLAEVVYGRSPNAVRSSHTGYPMYGTGGVVGYSSAPLFDREAVIVPRKGSLGNPQFAKAGFWAIDTTFVALPKEDVDAKWLYYQLAAFDLTKLNEATGVPSINRDWLLEQNFQTPSLAEQCRIATILSALDEQIETTEALAAKQQLMLDGLIDELLITPSRKERLSDYAEIGPRTNVSKVTDKVPFLPMDAVSEEGKISRVETKPWSSVSTGFTRFACGDVLVAKITPCFENGKGAHVPNSVPVWVGSTEFHVIRAKPGFSQRWVYWYTRAREFREKGAMQMTGSAGQQRVPRSFLESFPVRKVSEKEQVFIASTLDSVQEALVSERSLLSKLRLNKRGLMADLLTGRVRVHKEDIPHD